jgi:YVTN family beta-propeller protein
LKPRQFQVKNDTIDNPMKDPSDIPLQSSGSHKPMEKEILLVQRKEVDQDIYEAARTGAFERIEHILRDESEPAKLVNTPDPSGALPLHLATAHGQEKVVKLLLDDHANVNQFEHGESGRKTALQQASLIGHQVIVQLLLERGADIREKEEAEDRAQKFVQASQDRAEEAEHRREMPNIDFLMIRRYTRVDEDLTEVTEYSEKAAWYQAEADRKDWQRIILILQGERRRITAWNRIQEKKKEGKYSTICTNESFTVLEMVLMFLEAKAKAVWDRQAIAYVTNFISHTVSVIAIDSNVVIATIKVRDFPEEVAITPNGTKVYVTDANTHVVTIIDTNSHTVIDTVRVESKPHGVAVTPNGTKIYVTGDSDTITVIDTDHNVVIDTIPVGKHSHGVVITPNGARVYVTNASSDTVTVIATDSHAVIATIPVGSEPCRVAITPNGTKVYVVNRGNNTVTVIDTDRNVVIATIPVGEHPNAVAITPNGTKVYVVNRGSNTVTVIDTDSHVVTATIPVGKHPNAVAITPNGTKVYVTNAGSDTITVIDTDSHVAIATIPVGKWPHGVTIRRLT